MKAPEPPSDDEIQARLRRAAARSHGNPGDPEEDKLLHLDEELGRLDGETKPRRKLPEEDPHFAARLSNLEARASAIRQNREADHKKKEKFYRESQKDARSLGTGLAIVYAFIGFPLIGVGIGALVGHFTGSAIALSLGGFIGILAGCGCALVLVRWSDHQRP